MWLEFGTHLRTNIVYTAVTVMHNNVIIMFVHALVFCKANSSVAALCQPLYIRYCSFHVGLNCQSPNAYEVALESSAELFAYASDLGFQLNLLDIGGGFTTTELFEMVATGIKTALNTYFSSYPCVKVIAEPGITQ